MKEMLSQLIISQDATARSIADNVRVQEEATKSQAEANKSLDARVSVALGTTTIDSTPSIGVRWRRVPIQPAKYLHQWLSGQLFRTGCQNSGGLCFESQRPDHFRREHRRRRTSTHRGHRRRKGTQESRPTLRDRRLELDFRLERRTSSKNELDIHFYIERLLSSHVA